MKEINNNNKKKEKKSILSVSALRTLTSVFQCHNDTVHIQLHADSLFHFK
jgi:hypothetical protein